MPKDNLHGFNTTIQQVDERYAWINDMIRQDRSSYCSI